MMKFINPVTSEQTLIVFTTSSIANPYLSNRFQCTMPTTITYYESSATSDFYQNTGTLATTAATTSECTTCF
jgi:hypothetical protein